MYPPNSPKWDSSSTIAAFTSARPVSSCRTQRSFAVANFKNASFCTAFAEGTPAVSFVAVHDDNTPCLPTNAADAGTPVEPCFANAASMSASTMLPNAVKLIDTLLAH